MLRGVPALLVHRPAIRVSSGQKFATWRTLRLYVGHFSFDVPDRWAELEAVNDGDFTLLVKAESADEALGKYRDLIEKLDDSFEGFGAVGNVYLDSVSEIKELPPEGALSHFTKRSDDGRASVSSALPGVEPEYGVAFVWTSAEDEEGPHGRMIRNPFVYDGIPRPGHVHKRREPEEPADRS